MKFAGLEIKFSVCGGDLQVKSIDKAELKV